MALTSTLVSLGLIRFFKGSTFYWPSTAKFRVKRTCTTKPQVVPSSVFSGHGKLCLHPQITLKISHRSVYCTEQTRFILSVFNFNSKISEAPVPLRAAPAHCAPPGRAAPQINRLFGLEGCCATSPAVSTFPRQSELIFAVKCRQEWTRSQGGVISAWLLEMESCLVPRASLGVPKAVI